MSAKKKIIIFSVPFSGHLNVLKDFIKEHGNSFDFKLVITGWSNISANLDSLETETTIIQNSELHETDPALWTFPRLVNQLEECLKIARSFKPDIVLYDFFSIEGYFVGKILGIPYWSSIPALMGPFENREYLSNKFFIPINQESIKTISKKFNVEINEDEIEMISDGFHFPGQVNIVWSYKSITPENFKKNRKDVPYIFVGNLKENYKSLRTIKVKNNPKIYFSLGTVIMNNLWSQQEDTKKKLIDFITYLADLWKDRPWNIVFITQGKNIIETTPKNWTMFTTADQIVELKESDIFVTHGGNNSFHEAVLSKVPMVVIPFFGDQPLIGKKVEELGIGINLLNHTDISTQNSKEFLNNELAEKVDKAIQNILDTDKYRKAFDNLNLEHTEIKSFFEGKISFSEGDLLFGTNIARKKYVEKTDCQEEFKILEFKAFSELISKENALPRIVDIYHDVVLNNEYFEKDVNSSLNPYTEILKRYKEYLGESTDFCTMCIKGLDFFSELFKIHFILTEYDSETNYITTKEIMHIINNREKFEKSVIFYDKVSTAWVPIGFEEVKEKFLIIL
ncbi:glycosyltransferase family 1 protein [Patescibacteria group bacterium]|nr:glycosyltransferase family 1 protein [Patescibacteria group bacterium]